MVDLVVDKWLGRGAERFAAVHVHWGRGETKEMELSGGKNKGQIWSCIQVKVAAN